MNDANPNDPPSPAAQLIKALIADASEDTEQTSEYWFGEVYDTNPAGIGEAAVHVRDDQVNAEFLIIAVPWDLVIGDHHLEPAEWVTLVSLLTAETNDRKALRDD